MSREPLRESAFDNYSAEKIMRCIQTVWGLLFVLIAANGSRAQETSQNFLHLGLAASDFHLRDDHASPLIFSKLGVGPLLQYTYEGKDNRHSFTGFYSSAQLTTSNQNFFTENWRGRISYSYLHSVNRFELLDHSCDVYCGASVTSFFCKSDYFYSLTGQFSGRAISSWYWSHSVDLISQMEFTLGRGELFLASLDVAVVSNVARPGYSPSADYNLTENEWKIKAFGETRVFPHNFSIEFLLVYRRPIISSLCLQLAYEFSSSTYDRPVEIQTYMNSIHTSLVFSI
jgi:hypothetical protein